MAASREGLTGTYNRFHSAHERASGIARLRSLHAALDEAVARVYGWDDLRLGHGFYELKQGNRFTVRPAARQEILDRLLELNHQRYDEEVAQGLHEKAAPQAKPRRTSKRGKGSIEGSPLLEGVCGR